MPPPTFSSDPPGTLRFTVRVSTFEDLKRQIENRIGAFWPDGGTVRGDSVEWDARPEWEDVGVGVAGYGVYTWTVDVRYRTRP